MAQADYVVANGTGAAVRSDLNDQLAAIVSNNSGATEPATMYAYQWWADTTTGLLKLRNSANNAWVTVGTLADANLGLLTSGSTIVAPLGDASTPGITFTGDLNTGIFSPTADQLAISTSGTERVEFGTSEVVFNDGGANYDFRIEGDTNSSLFFVDASADTVEINGDVTIADKIIHGGDTNTAIRFPAADTVSVETDGSERARIDSSGRLLVGTSSARGNIYVGSTNLTPNNQFETAGNNYNGVLSLINYSALGYSPMLTMGLSLSNTQGTNTAVNTNKEYGIINFVGNDGTNFRSGAYILASCDGAVSTGDLPTRLVFSTTDGGTAIPIQRMRITAGGEVLIHSGNSFGDTGVSISPGASGYYSTTAGTGATSRLRFVNANGQVGEISTSGSSTTYATTSDYRLKENVVLLTGAIDRLQQVPVYRFNFIADSDKTVDGFIAHEAQEIVPECVTGEKDAVDEEGNPIYQGIDQSKLVPLLTAALQEAIAEIASLKDRVAALEGV